LVTVVKYENKKQIKAKIQNYPQYNREIYLQDCKTTLLFIHIYHSILNTC